MGEGAVNVGDVEAVLKLRDEFSDVAAKFMDTLGELIPGLDKLAIGVAVVTAAVTAAIVIVEQLGERGSDVNDVASSFGRLSDAAGVSRDALDKMREATVGTVSDYQLMIDANHLLAVNAVTSADELKTVAEAGRILAKQFGGETQESIEGVSKALERGNASRLAMKGVSVDTQKAEEAYANSLGVTIDDLDKTTKLAIDRKAIMQALAQVVKNAGDEELDFKEKIEQAWTAVKNLTDELAGLVAQSPVLAAGMDAVKAALVGAFGKDTTSVIRAIATAIDEGAIELVSFGKYAVMVGADVVVGWYAVKKLWGDLAQIIDGDTLILLGFKQAWLDLKIAVTGGSDEMTVAWNKNNNAINDLMVAMKKRGDALQQDDAAQKNVAASAAKFDAAIDSISAKMKTAQQASTDFVGPLQDLAGAHGKAGEAAGEQAKSLDGLGLSSAKVKAATEESVNRTTQLWGEYFKAVAAGTGDMVAQQIAEENNWYQSAAATLAKGKALNLNYWNELEALEDAHQARLDVIRQAAADREITRQIGVQASIQKLFDDMESTRIGHSGTSIEKEIADINRWVAAQMAAFKGTADEAVQFYASLSITAAQKLGEVGVDWTVVNAQSSDSLNNTALVAQKTYEYMVAHSNKFREADILNQKAIADAAATAANSWATSFGDACSEEQKALDKLAKAAMTSFAVIGKSVDDVTDSVKKATQATQDYFTIAGGVPGGDEKTQNYSQYSGEDVMSAYAAGGVPTTISMMGATKGVQGYRAGGGPVSANNPYVVGENGAELFIPGQSGMIVPNGSGGGGGGSLTIAGGAVVINYPIMNDATATRMLGNVIGDALMSKLRAQGFRQPSQS